MKRLFVKLALFLLVNTLIVMALLEYIDLQDNDIKADPSVTESVLLGLGSNTHYDLLLMGSSHGRNLTRSRNFYTLKRLTGKSIGTIAQSAAGLVPEFLWLKYFYLSGNHANTVLYVLDPFVFYTPKWNESLFFLKDEPFRWSFFRILLFSGIDMEVKYNYIKSKYKSDWRLNRGLKVQPEEGSLKDIDTAAVRSRIAALYPDGTPESSFHRYATVLREIADYCQVRNTSLIFVLPPTLLGKLPGKEKVIDMLKELKNKNKATYFDFSDSIRNPALYYNHDHLNPGGMAWYISNCLPLVFQSRQ